MNGKLNSIFMEKRKVGWLFMLMVSACGPVMHAQDAAEALPMEDGIYEPTWESLSRDIQ